MNKIVIFGHQQYDTRHDMKKVNPKDLIRLSNAAKELGITYNNFYQKIFRRINDPIGVIHMDGQSYVLRSELPAIRKKLGL